MSAPAAPGIEKNESGTSTTQTSVEASKNPIRGFFARFKKEKEKIIEKSSHEVSVETKTEEVVPPVSLFSLFR